MIYFIPFFSASLSTSTVLFSVAMAVSADFVFSVIFILLSALAQQNKGQTTTPFPLSAVRVQLIAGTSEREGLVLVYYGGQWGTICSDGWTVQDAAVVCRMLGYVGVARAIPGGTFFPPGNGSIFLRGVTCDGNEASIAYCQYQGWSIPLTTCTHAEDAGVICLGDFISSTITTTPGTTPTTLPPTICNNPSPNIRLVVNNSTIAVATGRVQYLYNNVWRSICNDRWGYNDAAVACRMLCYNPGNARAIIGSSVFGNATEGFWFGSVVCNGAETDLALCSHSPFGQSTCDETEAAGVSCILDSPTPPPVPQPIIVCTNEEITAQFLQSADPFLQAQYLSVSGPNGEAITNCGYQTSADQTYVTIAIPFMNCNTTKTLNSTHIIYSNVVRYAVPSQSNIITRTQIYYVQVSCIINRTADPNNDVNPQTRTPPPQSGSGVYTVQLLLFKDNRFTDPIVSDINNPPQITLGDWVYAGVQLYSTDPNLKLILINCYASTSVSASATPQYNLIQNKCVVEPTVTLYPINDTLFAFRFQSFQFLSNTTTFVYLHANVYVCSVTETTGNCDRNCLTRQTGQNAVPAKTASSKRRRSANTVIDGPYSVDSQLIIFMDNSKNALLLTSHAAITATSKVGLASNVSSTLPPMTSSIGPTLKYTSFPQKEPSSSSSSPSLDGIELWSKIENINKSSSLKVSNTIMIFATMLLPLYKLM